MNFSCECGQRIHDTSDYLSYKGHLISDQDWFDFMHEIDAAIEKSGPTAQDKVKALMKIRILSGKLSQTVYQCSKCGNIFFSDKNSPSLEMFRGCSDDTNKRLLKSALGDEWQGFLHGDWVDEPPEWRFKGLKGYISASCFPETKEYDDWESLERDYYQILSDLSGRNVLRSSSLEKNGVKIHLWHLNSDK